MKAYHMSIDDLSKQLQTNLETGLNASQVEKRQKQDGENKLEEAKKKTNLEKFIDQFKDAMIIILLIAAAISFGLAFQEKESSAFFEPLLILFIVIVNAIMGVFQENKAEKSLAALMSLSSPKARVIRDGQESLIDAKELVVWRLNSTRSW